jgi:DNA modification methylase
VSYDLHIGDALAVLRTMPTESIQCCVTSPPYWGLRDYGTGRWEGGEQGCDHLNRHGMQGESGERADRSFTGAQNFYKDVCGRCGARRVDRQIGLEPTPEEFVAKTVEVFREVRRVLRADGTCWVNLGDSYASSWLCNRRSVIGAGSMKNGKREARAPRMSDGLKEKDLVGIPWRVAFALQADGWWLRQDIIWSKPNPMPESVRDRCTKAHEYVFLLTKSARYHYDAEAILEECSPNSHARLSQEVEAQIGSFRANGGAKTNGPMKAVSRKTAAAGSGIKNNTSMASALALQVERRNKRSVWTIPTQSCKEAHFATFPEALVEPCILAGSRVGDRVLDPFGGSGTTGVVALRLGRVPVLIELNAEYANGIARPRLEAAAQQPDFLNTVETRA